MIHNTPQHSPIKYNTLLRWSKLRQEQLSQAILVTKETVLSFIKRQIEKGDMQAIEDFIHGKPMTRAGRFMLDELRGKIVGNLIMRMGLRKVIAVGLAMMLLPFILIKVAGELLNKTRVH